MKFRPLATALVAASLAALPSLGAELAVIERPHLNELNARAFMLDRAQDVHITGTIAAARSTWSPARIWLLDAATRKVVWDAADAELSRSRRGIARFDEKVALPAGEYEVYVATFPGTSGRWDRHGWDIHDLFGQLREYMDLDGLEDVARDVGVRIDGEGAARGDALSGGVSERFARGAVVSLVGVGNDAEVSAGFALRQDADVRVTCVGEVLDDGAYDAGWIENADNGGKVWQFDTHGARHAGGNAKNRSVDEVVHLAAGRYVAHFATDSSHSYPEFNAPPPDDPTAWGLVVRPARPQDAALIEPFSAAEAWQRNTLAQLVEVRDDEHRRAGFTLRRPLKVRVVAVGEGTHGDMYDYGWIVDARSHETVWEMRYHHTEHAGGGEKNRIADEVIDLPAGDYVVHFSTDGSHAYGDWNSAPPLERRRWGITVLAIDTAFTRSDVAPYDPDALGPALARLTRVRDHERREATFTLEQETDVEVYALGESDGRDMADYGWIEEAGSGKTVWEMRFRDTERAGGARKNRVARQRIHLPAGSYRVFYESDGSHSYDDWNAAPPRDPEAWGITVTLAGRIPAEAAPGR